MTATDVVPVTGRAIEEDSPAPSTREPLTWMTFLNYVDWTSGRMGNVVIAIGLNVADIYGRISATPLTQIGNYSVGQLLITPPIKRFEQMMKPAQAFQVRRVGGAAVTVWDRVVLS